MDRRSVLIGSGTALALTIAGCMEDGNGGGDEPADDVQTGGENDGNDDGSNDDGDGLPGIDESDLDDLSEYITVTEVTLEDRTLRIVAEVTKDSKEKGMADLGHGLKKGIKDVDALREKVDWLELVLYDGEEKVFTATIDIDWIVKLVEDEIDIDAFISHLEDEYQNNDG